MKKAKFQFIDAHRGRWSVSAMCRVLKVTRQGYYQWASRPVSAHDERDFDADGPNRAWFADITYVKTYQGWLYVAVVIDIWSRMVVGWAMGPQDRRGARRRRPQDGDNEEAALIRPHTP